MDSGLKQGLTFIEILLAIMLFALFLSVVIAIFDIVGYRFHYAEESKKIEILTPYHLKIKNDILLMKNALKLYKLDNGFYPTTAQGLDALVNKPTKEPVPEHWAQYLVSIPLDPNGLPYKYIKIGDSIDVKVTRKK